MKTYKVTIQKIVEQNILVLATDEADAVMAVLEGEGSKEGPARYVETLGPESWSVKPTNNNGSDIEE